MKLPLNYDFNLLGLHVQQSKSCEVPVLAVDLDIVFLSFLLILLIRTQKGDRLAIWTLFEQRDGFLVFRRSQRARLSTIEREQEDGTSLSGLSSIREEGNA